MRGDWGTPRGLRAQQTNSRAAGGTTNFRRAEPNRRTRNQYKKSTPSADVITAGRSAQNDPSRQNQPAKNQTDGRRAKQIRRAIKNTGEIPTEGHQSQTNPLQQRTAIKIQSSDHRITKTIQHHPIIKPSNTIHFNQPIQSIQPTNHSINQSNQPINQPIQSTNQSTNPINQPTTQTTNHSINQSTKHPITATIKLQLTIQITNKHSTPTFNNKTQHSNHPTSSKTCEQSRKPRRQIKPAFKGCPERSQ